nr:MAG TPA: hypothetical protein [Caudoviricetes sp.]
MVYRASCSVKYIICQVGLFVKCENHLVLSKIIERK